MEGQRGTDKPKSQTNEGQETEKIQIKTKERWRNEFEDEIRKTCTTIPEDQMM